MNHARSGQDKISIARDGGRKKKMGKNRSGPEMASLMLWFDFSKSTLSFLPCPFPHHHSTLLWRTLLSIAMVSKIRLFFSLSILRVNFTEWKLANFRFGVNTHIVMMWCQ